jgi:ribosomal-protein-alanine N-acetyltransferase
VNAAGLTRGVSPRHPGWPTELGPLHLPARSAGAASGGVVRLRPLRRADGRAWREIRLRDRAVIEPWDASSGMTWEQRHSAPMWRSHRALLAAGARRGEAVPFVITVDGAFAGQVTLGGIQRGAVLSGWVGYWVDSRLQGRGVATAAVAMTLAHAFDAVGLHRVEATIAPENGASRAVVTHLGFRQEGLLQRYLDIDGAWRDHLLYAMTREELPGGLEQLLARWARIRQTSSGG